MELTSDELWGEASGEIGGRSARQWLDSTIAYCEFRAGRAWRRYSDRQDSEYLDWLDAVRLLMVAKHAPDEPQTIHPVLPQLERERVPAPSPAELALMEWKRPELVAALLHESPDFSQSPDYSRRILSHFTKAKLARMLAELRAKALDSQRVYA